MQAGAPSLSGRDAPGERERASGPRRDGGVRRMNRGALQSRTPSKTRIHLIFLVESGLAVMTQFCGPLPFWAPVSGLLTE